MQINKLSKRMIILINFNNNSYKEKILIIKSILVRKISNHFNNNRWNKKKIIKPKTVKNMK